ncbi:MAG: DUF4251 domain-containing protein [Odoribacteraceae bacterium]|jgi:hypothetical protein|nr:DUF4251 domain-containing protein [Odoribacteraceae bacterium]
MNTLKCILSAGVLLFSCLSAPAGERREEKRDTTAFDKLVALVKSQVFYVEATDAYPTGNSSVTITSQHGTTTVGGEGHVSLAANRGELFFRDTVVTGHLPFFGRAYSLPYGEGGGFEFAKSRIDKATVKVVKKRKRQHVAFTCSMTVSGDVITVTIEAYENGRCTIQVNSNNRASISYGGLLGPITEETP